MNQIIVDRLNRLAASPDPVTSATAKALLEQYRYAEPEVQAQIELRFKFLIGTGCQTGPTETK